MPDREKVIKGLEELYGFLFREYANIPAEESKIYYERTCAIRDALAMLKEQEEREKAICKEICDFIRHGCSTDTDEDKDYVCHVIQQCFIKFGRSVK